MKFADILQKTRGMPCFTPGFLDAGEDPAQVRVQISRWVRDGRVLRLHKGLYAVAEPYRGGSLEPFCVANRLRPASYVSLQSALAWHGLIPEFVPVTTSVTTGRPQRIETPIGGFLFRHVGAKRFWGFQEQELATGLIGGQTAFVAEPEKALLDLVYLTPGADKREFIEELRLQNLETLDTDVLDAYAQRFASPKVRRAAAAIKGILAESEGVAL